MKRILSLIAARKQSPLFALAALAMASSQSHAQSPAILPGTKLIDQAEADLSERLMDGAHAFVERKIEEAIDLRPHSSPDRESLQKMIGAVDDRISPVTMEKFGEGDRPGLVAENGWFRVWQVRWPVLEGVWSEGLLVEPATTTPKVNEPLDAKIDTSPEKVRSSGPARFLIAIPDANESPEDVIGIGKNVPLHHQHVPELAKTGFTILIPALIDRRPYLGDPEDARIKRSNQTHREWIYRQAFQLGRHVIGYEVQKVQAAVDWITASHPDAIIACGGYGEGGLIALYAAAIDTRINTAVAGGYLGNPQPGWSQPIFRNRFGFETEFSDHEIISLLSQRKLVAHSIPGPVFEDSKGSLTGEEELPVATHSAYASDSVHTTVDFNPALQTAGLYNTITGTEAFSDDIRFNSWLRHDDALADARSGFSSSDRHDRLFKQLGNHVQQLIRDADIAREEWFLYQAEPLLRPGKWSTNKEHPTLDPAKFIGKAKTFRENFAKEAMGEFDEPLLPLNPRTRLITETDDWAAWDVMLDVYPELFAWGALILPKDLKPGEKRPVVVCQHGRNGLPRDSIDADTTAYNNFAAKLAERGFITFAPHNLYRGEDRYRWLDRKANAVGCSLFSFIIPSHRQILNWLKTQPNVDPDHIAFYGLSYGGESAVRIPPVLEDYAVVICSGDFNQWTRKVAATDHPGTFMKTIEWEMPYWNLGNTFDYAEMAYLIFPRPFMVERGHHDGVGIDSWVAHEYAKVRRLYAQFGMADRTEIEFFQGGHSINGKGTLDFLHKHLNWPKPTP